MKVKSQCVLITGSTGDIGLQLVSECLEKNYFVIATDKKEKPIDFQCDAFLKFDFSESNNLEQEVHTFCEKIFDIIAKNDLNLFGIINNAAIQILGAFTELSLGDYRKSFDVNFFAPLLILKGLYPELVKTSGSIVNIGSIHSKLTKRNFSAYATSKAAFSALTKSLSLDLGTQIRINIIEPAAIDTKMLSAGFVNKPELRELLDLCHPIGRIGTPKDVAKLACWLLSSEAAFVHGAQLNLDGGISNRLYDPIL
jgi:NAD(P)-dependent dehydrogenase (short-subunit alcohol dehydrogenase family)